MINYGFDEGQVEALKWARTQAYVKMIQVGQLVIQYALGAKSQYPEWAKECKERLPKVEAQEEELRNLVKTFDELLVTEKM